MWWSLIDKSKSDHRAVHLKLTQCCMSIISQYNWKEKNIHWKELRWETGKGKILKDLKGQNHWLYYQVKENGTSAEQCLPLYTAGRGFQNSLKESHNFHLAAFSCKFPEKIGSLYCLILSSLDGFSHFLLQHQYT